MKRSLVYAVLPLLFSLGSVAQAIEPPAGVVSRAGDLSVVLHWDASAQSGLVGYRVYRSATNTGPFTVQSGGVLSSPGFCDLNVSNGQTNYYYITCVGTHLEESGPSQIVAVAPHAFGSDDEFLDYIQQVHFDYFWYLANPTNGLIPDRTAMGSACSIAAVGFGLTAIGIGIDHGWITRTQGVARVLATLGTFLNKPQSTAPTGTIGYNGWFYHFLDMTNGLRSSTGVELSSIDTALLLGGVVYAREYFDGNDPDEASIRSMADGIYNRVDWNWMARGTNVFSMGWFPPGSFLANNWIGYNEGMLLYILGLGATNPVPASAWDRWTSGYTWATYYGQSFVPFAPLFGHQYSECWIDFRHVADAYMTSHNSTYFENSRRATLAQRSYCLANPSRGYSSNIWGLTACDSPGGYIVHGAPPAENDDGTVAPTAAGGSIAFTPEYSVPTLRYFYRNLRRNLWTAYGFRDGYNTLQNWAGPDELGIDQGPIVIMIENYRTQRVWKTFMKNGAIQRGIQRAGFVPLSFVPRGLEILPAQSAFSVAWNSSSGQVYQVEYSPDLSTWFSSPTGEVLATNTSSGWLDTGPPATSTQPLSVPQRFYRVFQYGATGASGFLKN